MLNASKQFKVMCCTVTYLYEKESNWSVRKQNNKALLGFPVSESFILAISVIRIGIPIPNRVCKPHTDCPIFYTRLQQCLCNDRDRLGRYLLHNPL